MRIKFWGTRSSVASPGRNTDELGGNTPCLVIKNDNEPPMIFNAGTGIIEYATKGIDFKNEKEFHLFFSNFSWDLIQGFPFFIPIHIPDVNIHLYSARPISLMKDNFTRLFDGSYSPLRDLSYLNANIHFHFLEDSFALYGNQIDFKPSNHPGRSYAFRLRRKNFQTGIVYHHENKRDITNNSLVDFLKNSDVLIHDAKFTEKDYLKNINWGHSSIERAIENAENISARYLYLTSYHFFYTDDFIRLYLNKHYRKKRNSEKTKIFLSSENQSILFK